MDAEYAVLMKLIELMAPLSRDEAKRVLDYLYDRFVMHRIEPELK